MATVNDKMTAIADAIRERTGETEPLTLDDMATDIPKVYEKGKQAERDEFWDAYQENGKRTQYNFAFAVGCNFKFNPCLLAYKPLKRINFGIYGYIL